MVVQLPEIPDKTRSGRCSHREPIVVLVRTAVYAIPLVGSNRGKENRAALHCSRILLLVYALGYFTPAGYFPVPLSSRSDISFDGCSVHNGRLLA